MHVCNAMCYLLYSRVLIFIEAFINILVCTYGNSTGSLLLPPPLFSKPVAPPPPPPPPPPNTPLEEACSACSQHKTP